MAGLAAGGIASLVGLGLRVGSTIIGGVAQARAGRAERDAANFEAAQIDDLAQEERAAGQQESFEIDRQVRTLLSQGRAAAAASGAGASDIGVANVQADLARAGEVRAETARYTADQRGKGLNLQAEMRRRGGQAALTGARLAAMGTIVGGVGSAFGDFGSWAQTYGGTAPVTMPVTGGFMPAASSAGRVGPLRRIFGGG